MANFSKSPETLESAWSPKYSSSMSRCFPCRWLAQSQLGASSKFPSAKLSTALTQGLGVRRAAESEWFSCVVPLLTTAIVWGWPGARWQISFFPPCTVYNHTLWTLVKSFYLPLPLTFHNKQGEWFLELVECLKGSWCLGVQLIFHISKCYCLQISGFPRPPSYERGCRRVETVIFNGWLGLPSRSLLNDLQTNRSIWNFYLYVREVRGYCLVGKRSGEGCFS